MTAIWGPIGWITLHSVASCYPDSPTPAEKALMNSWILMFHGTITCPTCQEHFGALFNLYTSKYPNLFNSRTDFLTFTFRAHNAVNKRLSKPIQGSVRECFETLRNATSINSSQMIRTAYLNHINRYWRTIQDVHGFGAQRKVRDMKKIEDDYFSKRDGSFTRDILEVEVVVPLSTNNEERSMFVPRYRNPPPRVQSPLQPQPPPQPERQAPSVSFLGGRLRLMRQ
jgi:hypothetical protein